MKTGFSILKGRLATELLDVEYFEDKYNFELPPIYRTFVQNFYLGEKGIHREQYFMQDINLFLPFSTYNFYYNDENIGFINFVEIDIVFDFYTSGGLNSFDYDEKYLSIASCDLGGLFVGTQNDSTDKIIFWQSSTGKYITIANNIFDFVKGIIVETVDEMQLHYGVKYSQLYKNHGEDFYRVRE